MRYLVLGICVLAAGCAGEAPALLTAPTSTVSSSAETQARGGSQLPFHGSYQAVETNVIAPPNLEVDGTASGTATHLGRFTAPFHVTVSLATGSATGSVTFIAANGDRIRATFTGQATPTGEPNVVSIEEVATIADGTGRFAHATGSFTIVRVLRQLTGVSTGTFDGTISLGH